MPGTDFSKHHTYKWVSIEGGAHPNHTVDAEIKQAVDFQLASKGLAKTDSDKADLYVGYQIAVDREKQWNGYGMGGGIRWGGMASASSSTINIGNAGPRHVRPVHQAVGLDRECNQDAGPQLQPGKKPEKSKQSDAEIVQELSAETEVASFTSRHEGEINDRYAKSNVPDLLIRLPCCIPASCVAVATREKFLLNEA